MYFFNFTFILLKFYFDPYSRCLFFCLLVYLFVTSIIFEGGGTTIQFMLRAPIWPAAALGTGASLPNSLPVLVCKFDTIGSDPCQCFGNVKVFNIFYFFLTLIIKQLKIEFVNH